MVFLTCPAMHLTFLTYRWQNYLIIFQNAAACLTDLVYSSIYLKSTVIALFKIITQYSYKRYLG